MSDLRSLVIKDGTQQQIANTDTLIVGAKVDAASGQTLSIGDTNATSITIGKAGISTDFPGPVTLTGDVTTVGGTTFTTDATFEGNVTFGNANTDTVDFLAKVDSDINFAGGSPTYKITNLANGTNPNDAVNYSQLSAIVSGVSSVTASAPLASSGGATPDISLTGIVAVANGGTNSSSFTAGSVIFAGAGGTSLTQDNANLFWDDSNNRLGIGTTSPNEKLTVSGALSVGEQGSAPSSTSAFGKLWANSAGATAALQAADARPYWTDDTGQSYNLTLDRFNTLTAGATVTIDASPALPIFNSVTLNQNTTFATSNLGVGRSASVRVLSGGSTRTLTWPAGWTWLGSGAPSSLASTDVGYLSIVAYGTADTDVVAAWSYQNQAVAVTGSGVDNQIATWSGTYTQDGSANLTFDGSTLTTSNGASATDIFVAKDNTTAVLTVADGGDTTIAPVAGHAGDALTITGGTLASTKKTLTLSGTLTSGGSDTVAAIATTVSSGTLAKGLAVSMTGAGTPATSYAGIFSTSIAGNGQDPINAIQANFAVLADSAGVTATGHNVGVWGGSNGSSARNYGIFGVSASDTSGANTAVTGMARNNGGGVRIGGLFASQTGSTQPTVNASAALIADNMDLSDPIFLARDNGTTVFTVDNSGYVLAKNSSDSTTAFRVQNAAGTTILDVDTSNSRVGVGTAGPTATFSVAEKLLVDSNGRITKYDNSAPTDGELLIGDTTAGYLKKTTLTAGTGISVTNGAGSITITATGAPATSLTVGTTTIASGTANRILYQDGASPTGVLQESANLTFDGSTLTTSNGASATDIFVAKDNTTAVLTVADDGDTTIAPVAGHAGNALTITGGTLASTKKTLTLSGTLTSGGGDTVAAIATTVTSGTLAKGLDISMSGAGTPNQSWGLSIYSTVAGNGADPVSAANGNYGVFSVSDGVTGTGSNIGVDGHASGGLKNYGLFGNTTNDGSGKTNVAVAGVSKNNFAPSTGTRIGGIFAIQSSGSAQLNANVSAALIADNMDVSDPIFLARDNGTTVFTVGDNGTVLSKNSSDSTTAFQVQNAAGTTTVLDVDTSNSRVGIGTAGPTATFSVAEKLLVDSNGRITKYDNASITKGDLLAGSAASGYVAVAVGTNGQVLQADSTATGGVSWYTIPAATDYSVVSLTTAQAANTAVTVGGSAAIATAASTSRVAGIVKATNSVQVLGICTCDIEASITISAGDVVYLSAANAGKVTNVAPSTATQVVAELGIATANGSGAGGTVAVLWQPKSIVVL